MTTEIFDISLSFDGKLFNGWVRPSEKKDDSGKPVSYHVVLNDVFFGNVSFNDTWIVDDQRPRGLVQAVGACIEAHRNV